MPDSDCFRESLYEVIDRANKKVELARYIQKQPPSGIISVIEAQRSWRLDHLHIRQIRSTLGAQSDLIGAPAPMSIGAVLTAPIGG
jgi:hypothetical protein